MSEGGNPKEGKSFEQEQGADRDLFDAEWLLDELDRVWFHDNALSFHIGDWLRSVQRSIIILCCSDCSDFPYESIEKKKSIAKNQHYEPCIKQQQHQEEQQQQQEPQIVEMEEVSRSLRETGKVFSTGDLLPRARLAKISRRDLVKDDLQQHPIVWEDDSSETNSTADCFSEGAASTEDILPGDEEEVRRLETIPSSSALLPPAAAPIQQEVLPRRRRRRQRRKHTRSLSELEFDELRGFRDLGFKLTKEDLTPRVVGLVPALSMPPAVPHSSTRTEANSSDEIVRAIAAKEGNRGTALSPYRERIYPSHAWSIRRPDSPLLNLRMPDPNREGVDMKAHLKFWARAVASTVRQEC